MAKGPIQKTSSNIEFIAAAQLHHFIKQLAYLISSMLEYILPAWVTLVVTHNLPLLSNTSVASAYSTHRVRCQLLAPTTIEPNGRVILTMLWVAWYFGFSWGGETGKERRRWSSHFGRGGEEAGWGGAAQEAHWPGGGGQRNEEARN
jgi:hypothetical protein